MKFIIDLEPKQVTELSYMILDSMQHNRDKITDNGRNNHIWEKRIEVGEDFLQKINDGKFEE